jgi:antitoxin (DNA-binding transcriptional repressor) of toxin-antitoxin stability system
MYMSDAQPVHMKTVTITELRRNIFRLIDESLATGEPIVLNRKGKRVVLRPDTAAPAVETEAEREERLRKFWEEPPPPGWEDCDLSVEALKAARREYWQWDQESELDH